jgi:hypothetical protein
MKSALPGAKAPYLKIGHPEQSDARMRGAQSKDL